MTRRDLREVRDGVSLGVAGMALFWILAAAVIWLASSCAPEPAFAQSSQPPRSVHSPADGTKAPAPLPQVRLLPIITGTRFAWPTPAMRAVLARLWQDDREFAACVMHVAIFVRDTAAIREETWIIDSIVPGVSQYADQSSLVDTQCPEHTIGFIHSHPLSRVCNLSSGDFLAGSLFQFAFAGVVCSPDGAVGFAFNPLLPPIAPAPVQPDARLPPDTTRPAPQTPHAPPAPDEGSGT